MIMNYSNYIDSVEKTFKRLFDLTADIISCDTYYCDEERYNKESFILDTLTQKDASTLALFMHICNNAKDDVSDNYYTFDDDGKIIQTNDKTDLKGDQIIARLVRYVLLSDVICEKDISFNDNKKIFNPAEKQLESIALYVESNFEYSNVTKYDSVINKKLMTFNFLTDDDLNALYVTCESIKRFINLSKENERWKMWNDVTELSDEEYVRKYTISKNLFKHIDIIRNNLENEVISRRSIISQIRCI